MRIRGENRLVMSRRRGRFRLFSLVGQQVGYLYLFNRSNFEICERITYWPTNWFVGQLPRPVGQANILGQWVETVERDTSREPLASLFWRGGLMPPLSLFLSSCLWAFCDIASDRDNLFWEFSFQSTSQTDPLLFFISFRYDLAHGIYSLRTFFLFLKIRPLLFFPLSFSTCSGRLSLQRKKMGSRKKTKRRWKNER